MDWTGKWWSVGQFELSSNVTHVTSRAHHEQWNWQQSTTCQTRPTLPALGPVASSGSHPAQMPVSSRYLRNPKITLLFALFTRLDKEKSFLKTWPIWLENRENVYFSSNSPHKDMVTLYTGTHNKYFIWFISSFPFGSPCHFLFIYFFPSDWISNGFSRK